MFDKYITIDINKYKECLQEVGDAAQIRGDQSTFTKIVQEWHKVEEYQKSLTAPWGTKV